MNRLLLESLPDLNIRNLKLRGLCTQPPKYNAQG